MSKKILFCTLFILIFLIPSKQDPNAKTWERHNTTVHADSILAAIERGDSIIIRNCEISGALGEGEIFARQTIKSYIEIGYSTFLYAVAFRNCYFKETVYFFADTFYVDVHFSLSSFGGDASFNGAIFIEDADFSGATFGRDAYFSSILFFGDADFSGAIFGGQIDLSPKEFKDIDISWKQLEGHLVYNRTANYKFMKHFEEKRMLDDADAIYLFLKKKETSDMKWYKLSKYWEYLMWVTCGFGVKPVYTILWNIGIILLFTLFYIKSNAIREIEKEYGHRRRRRKYRIVRKGFWKRFYDAFYFSVHTFIIGVVSDWHPTAEFLINTRKIKLFKFRTLSMIEGALGWILLVLFVVTMTRKCIR